MIEDSNTKKETIVPIFIQVAPLGKIVSDDTEAI
jgi:uncharacterized protein YoxC